MYHTVIPLSTKPYWICLICISNPRPSCTLSFSDPVMWIWIAFKSCCPSTLHSVFTFCVYILYFTFCILYHCVITIWTLDQIKKKISLSLSLLPSLSPSLSLSVWLSFQHKVSFYNSFCEVGLVLEMKLKNASVNIFLGVEALTFCFSYV